MEKAIHEKKKQSFDIEAFDHVQLTGKNFLYKDIKITGSAKYGDREKRLRVGLLDEEILNTPFFAGIDVSGKWENDERYHLKGEGEDIYAGIKLAEKIKLTLKFEYQDITIYRVSDTAPAILRNNIGNSQIGDMALILERSSLDSRYYPTKGAYYGIEWDCAAEGFGSDYDFNRLTWQYRYYITPEKFFTFMFRTKLGWVEEFGNTNDVPYSERFFAGGSSTVRGYKGRQVGPKDTVNLPVGGDFLWVNNFETRFPVYKKLTGAYFLDAGSVWSRFDSFRADDLKCGTGAGLRYITKWGVVRLDYGVRLTHDHEPRTRLHLTFGIPF